MFQTFGETTKFREKGDCKQKLVKNKYLKQENE